MAEAVISAIIGDAVSRVISLLMGRLSSHSQHQDSSSTKQAKLQTVSHTLMRIHSAVEEAKGRHITNHGTLQWLSELIDGEYQGRYLLDSIRRREQQEEAGPSSDDDDVQVAVVAPQSSSLSLLRPAKRMRVVAARCALSGQWHQDPDVEEVDRVLERLRAISQDLMEFIMLLQNCHPIRRPLATAIFRDGQMFGRHVEKQRIINFLLQDDDRPTREWELGVLPILGRTGTGKTTLVQHACDDARVRSHFPVIMLYNFSCTFVVATNEGTASNPLELVKGEKFRDKRFLIVFEDVDALRMQVMNELLRSLRRVKEGSKVIVITNDRRVATTMGTAEPIVLKVLPWPEYWFFFKAHAFAGGDTEDNPRLIAVGKEIARKLSGSFFGAKIVGELLRDHPDAKFWWKVLRSNIWGLSLLGDGITYISDLAENMMPGHIEMWEVTISVAQSPSQHYTELPRLKDLCSAAPHGTVASCWADDIRFAKVLLCKSVLPFYNQYYIARCACACTCRAARRVIQLSLKA